MRYCIWLQCFLELVFVSLKYRMMAFVTTTGTFTSFFFHLIMLQKVTPRMPSYKHESSFLSELFQHAARTIHTMMIWSNVKASVVACIHLTFYFRKSFVSELKANLTWRFTKGLVFYSSLCRTIWYRLQPNLSYWTLWEEMYQKMCLR